MTLPNACKAVPGAPVPSQFLTWVREDEEVAAEYMKARDIGYRLMADEVMDISDNPQEGQRRTVTTGPDGVITVVVHDDMFNHRQLRVNTRKWMLSKVLPKLYGDRITPEQAANTEAVAEALRAIAERLPV